MARRWPGLPGHGQLRDLGDVARGGRAVVGPVHPEVVAEVGPAVALAQVAARHARRGGVGHQRRGELVVARDQRVPVRLADVVVAGVGERRVEQRVELVRPPGERLEADVDEDRRTARVGHVGLGDPPAPGAGGVDLAVGEAARIGELDAVRGVLALALGERLPVAHHELQVADARRAEVGRVDLGQLTVVERQPGPARRARRGAHPVLVALRPGRDARPGRRVRRQLARRRGRQAARARRRRVPRGVGTRTPPPRSYPERGLLRC